jgi:hypothetical protein
LRMSRRNSFMSLEIQTQSARAAGLENSCKGDEMKACLGP